jgi:hypothetical protein
MAGIGKAPVSVVTVHIHYLLPGHTISTVSTNTAYWTQSQGKWYGLMADANYRALKAGRCP